MKIFIGGKSARDNNNSNSGKQLPIHSKICYKKMLAVFIIIWWKSVTANVCLKSVDFVRDEMSNET